MKLVVTAALITAMIPASGFADDWVCSTRSTTSGMPEIQKFAVRGDQITDVAGEKLFKAWGVEAALPAFQVVKNDKLGLIGVFTYGKDSDLMAQVIMINKVTGALKMLTSFASIDANVDVTSGVCQQD